MAEVRFVRAFHRDVRVVDGGRLSPVGAEGNLFLASEAPLPVGTRLVLEETDGTRSEVDVVSVVEQTAGVDVSGMRVAAPGAAEGVDDADVTVAKSGPPPRRRGKRRRS